MFKSGPLEPVGGGEGARAAVTSSSLQACRIMFDVLQSEV